jgi:toxin ParE1/3/4
MRVRFTAPAAADLEAIYNYISERNPQAATRVKACIKADAELLGDLPFIGRPADRPEVRVRAVNPIPT